MSKDNKILYRLIRPIITALFKLLYRPTIEGDDLIKDKRIILAGNHTSNLDCLLLISSTKRSIHFLAKKELFKFPLSIIFNHLGLIPVDRQNKSHNSLEMAYDYLNNDALVLVFPEGTTSKNKLLDFKIGAVKMANVTGSEIIPFVISGSYKIMKKSIKLTFLEPIKINGDLEEENKRLRKIIEEKMESERNVHI